MLSATELAHTHNGSLFEQLIAAWIRIRHTQDFYCIAVCLVSRIVEIVTKVIIAHVAI